MRRVVLVYLDCVERTVGRSYAFVESTAMEHVVGCDRSALAAMGPQWMFDYKKQRFVCDWKNAMATFGLC